MLNRYLLSDFKEKCCFVIPDIPAMRGSSRSTGPGRKPARNAGAGPGLCGHKERESTGVCKMCINTERATFISILGQQDERGILFFLMFGIVPLFDSK